MLQQPKFRCFQCIFEENINKSFTCSGNYILQGEPNKLDDDDCSDNLKDLKFCLYGRLYDESLLISKSDFNTLCLLARKGIVQLEQAAIKTSTSFKTVDYSEIRRRICELCLATRSFIIYSENQDVKKHLAPSFTNLLVNIRRLKQLPVSILLNSTKTNDDQDPSYNYIHLILDLNWLSLTTEHHINDEPNIKLEIFEQNLSSLLSDLIYISFQKFEKLNDYSNLTKQYPFICSCFKELWLLLQLFVEKLHNQQFCKDFWFYFNKVIKTEINLQESPSSKNAICSLWILFHVARIQGCNNNGSFIGPNNHRIVSNYPFIDQCLKVVTNLSSSHVEELMCSCVNLIASLQMTWWRKEASFEILQQLWEYFYKQLNTHFAPNESPNLIGTSQKSYDYLTLTDTILQHDLNVTTPSINSYELFLCFLGKYLNSNLVHWPKLKGRIYSKLSPPKLIALTDIGLHNLNQLFFVLAYSINFNELTDKLQSLLNQLPASRSENSCVIWSAHVSLLFMRVNRGISLSGISGDEYCAPILLAVQSVSSDRSQSHLMKIYIEGLRKLIENDKHLQCQEYLLFGSWINRYLQWCSHSDACNLLEILKNLIEKIRNLGGHPDWWTVIETHIVPSLTQLSSKSDSPQQVADVAATLVLADEKRFKNLLEHMISDSVPVSLTTSFLSSLLEQNAVTQIKDHQNILIQAWIRIAVLSTDKSSLTELTLMITQLPEWTTSVGSFEISSTEDPLYTVIRIAGCRMRDANSMADTVALKRWFETYFGKMDQWILPVLSTAEKGDNAQLVMRIYSCAALLFLHCAPALYIKNKNTCILYRLISTLLLPSSVLMNKRPGNVILAALKRTWHLFIRGIARLDFKTDNYIERTLKDLAVRYVPHMHDATSPVIRCLDSEFEDETTKFLLDKISNIFLACKSKNFHQFHQQALKLILEMSKTRYESQTKIEIFVRGVLPSIFEQMIFNEEKIVRSITFQILNCLKNNQYYSTLKEIFVNSIISVIEKHLPFYSQNVFRFLECLSSVLNNELVLILPNLNEAIKKVECMRGVGYDNNLRKGLKKIQEITNQQSK